jgi:DNA-binding transcriptional MerR regulator
MYTETKKSGFLRGGVMNQQERSYKDKKVISIGTVSELTGLTLRQIRYYEERKLIAPYRNDRGTRKYSFTDIETLMDIADKREDGVQTTEILKEMRLKEKKRESAADVRKKMLQGQLNAQFRYGRGNN